jgi:Zn-dependent membrane protease YugP
MKGMRIEVDVAWTVIMTLGAGAVVAVSHLYTMRIYRRFSSCAAAIGLTGAEIAERLLKTSGMSSIRIREASGVLSDRYDFRTRTVCLSSGTYRSGSVAALSIAAHEIGHVMQSEGKITRRRFQIPSTFAARITQVAGWGAVMALPMVVVGWITGWEELATLGALTMIWSVICSLLPLPVEMEASRTGMSMLQNGGYLTDDELKAAGKVLRAAAWSYVTTTGAALVAVFRDMSGQDAD